MGGSSDAAEGRFPCIRAVWPDCQNLAILANNCQKYRAFQGTPVKRKHPLSCDNSGDASFQLAESWGFEPQMPFWGILA